MSLGEVLGYAVIGLIGVYLAARLVSAAFFKSKQQYESEKHHAQ